MVIPHCSLNSQVGRWQRIHLPMQETLVLSLRQKDPWRRNWQPTLVFLPGKSRGQRSLVGCSSWGCKSAGHSLVTKQQWLMMSNIFQINWWNVTLSFCLFSNQIFFKLNFEKCFLYFYICPLSAIWFANSCLQSVDVPFSLLSGSFYRAEVFNFNEVQCINVLFCGLCIQYQV